MYFFKLTVIDDRGKKQMLKRDPEVNIENQSYYFVEGKKKFEDFLHNFSSFLASLLLNFQFPHLCNAKQSVLQLEPQWNTMTDVAVFVQIGKEDSD